jgi:putative transposase
MAKLPNRRSIRYPTRSYRQPGSYMFTICTHARRHILATAAAGRIRQTAIGVIAQRCWRELPAHFPNIGVDEFVVMTHHVHGIVIIHRWFGDRPPTGHRRDCVLPGSLSAIVRSYKAAVTREVHQLGLHAGPIWQRNYHERVLLDHPALEIARRYIANNPRKWIARGRGR